MLIEILTWILNQMSINISISSNCKYQNVNSAKFSLHLTISLVAHFSLNFKSTWKINFHIQKLRSHSFCDRFMLPDSDNRHCPQFLRVESNPHWGQLYFCLLQPWWEKLFRIKNKIIQNFNSLLSKFEQYSRQPASSATHYSTIDHVRAPLAKAHTFSARMSVPNQHDPSQRVHVCN
jgi:hypothetical protein